MKGRYSCLNDVYAGADPGYFKRGVSVLGLQAKKGGPGGSPTLGPMSKGLVGQKGGSGPPEPPLLDPPMG